MKRQPYFSIYLPAILIALLLIPPTIAKLCGKERWKNKVCQDSNVSKLFVTSGTLKPPIDITIAALRTMPAPRRPDARVSPVETSIYVLDAIITDYKEEAGAGDHDYHLALRDEQGRTMIAEIPSPECLKETPEPLKSEILQARADFDAHFKVTGQFKKTSTRVRVTGIGFFDRIHGQKGVAGNGIELHPVIKIEFLPFADGAMAANWKVI